MNSELDGIGLVLFRHWEQLGNWLLNQLVPLRRLAFQQAAESERNSRRSSEDGRKAALLQVIQEFIEEYLRQLTQLFGLVIENDFRHFT